MHFSPRYVLFLEFYWHFPYRLQYKAVTQTPQTTTHPTHITTHPVLYLNLVHHTAPHGFVQDYARAAIRLPRAVDQ